MRNKSTIFKISFLISIIFFTIANAGEIYQWVDEKGVKRFSDSPTDRNALRKNNAESYPAFIRKAPTTGKETSGFQENDSLKHTRETVTAEGHGNSVGGSQDNAVNRLGQSESPGEANSHNAGEVYAPGNAAGAYGKIPYGKSVPSITGSAGTPNSAFEKPSRQANELNQKIRENEQRQREIQEYNAKVREYNEKAAEIERKNQQAEEYNAKLRKHNDQILRQQYENDRRRTYESFQNRNRTIDHGSVSTPYLEKKYRTRR